MRAREGGGFFTGLFIPAHYVAQVGLNVCIAQGYTLTQCKFLYPGIVWGQVVHFYVNMANE